MIGFGPVGGGAPPRFQLLTSVDQGAEPLDPGALAQPGTAFDASTGTFTWNLADATIIDGYQENQVRWTRRVLDLYPQYDPDLDIIELALVIDQLTLTAAVPKWGIAFGVLDQIASLGGADGPMWGIKGNTAAQYNHGNQFATSDNFGNVMSGTPRWLIATFRQGAGTSDAGAENNEIASQMRAKSTAGAWEESELQAAPPMNNPVSDWVISIGHVHDSAINEATTIVARLFHRRIRTAGVAGLPE